MRFSLWVGVCALVLALAMSSLVQAATIQEVAATDFNPTVQDFYAAGYGHGAYYLTWNGPLNGNLFGAGAPTPGITYAGATNPAWLKFETTGNGGGGGGGGGAGGGVPMQSTFTLGNNDGGTWSMDFSVLMFDPGFIGDSVTIELIGSDPGSNYISKDLTAAEVVAGKMLKWTIDALAGEQVMVRITSFGDDTYAAGFFMDNAAYTAAIPEPASLALLALGITTAMIKRRRQ